MLTAGNFELVLMDVQMPELDGLTAARQIRASETQTGSRIPIVAMTAHAMKGDKERCLEAGMDGYISKPVSSQAIAETIAGIFGWKPGIRNRGERPIRPEPRTRWDRTKALERVGGDESLLSELVQIFLEESPQQLARLQTALETGDPEMLERAAHSLKGELDYLGLSDSAQKARDLERMGREHSLLAAAELLAKLQAELSEATSAIREAQDGKGAQYFGCASSATFVQNSD
jgi:CheY-like chemotaxis protein